MLACAGVFFAATAMFEVFYRNIWPVVLALPVLVFICCYPLLKRFTRLCHYYLGASLRWRRFVRGSRSRERSRWPADPHGGGGALLDGGV